ncbi:MAG: hypothetical protein DI535_14520 [Citrobacter freundii]|nr:MAG: hypothetical protein DI535_14520 [Citrobacter freundii]
MKYQLTVLFSFIMGISCCLAQPTISDFTPKSAAPGMSIKITGTGFTSVNTVTVGGVSSSYTVASATEINVTVPVSASGSVAVTTAAGTATRPGFIYVPTSGIITDFGGFWRTTAASPTATTPDNSHNLLAFTHNGVTYSTGVNNAVLTNNSIPFTPATFKALPVAAIAGVASGSGSTYVALASKVDGSATTAFVPGATAYTIKQSLIDGVNGLNLGTGVTNLPSTAVMTFQIYNINADRATDPEPDIILTQIASPSSSNDVFTFLDGSGNQVGTSFTQDMTLLPKLGTYILDLFTIGNIPYNAARPYSVASSGTNTTREIRVVSLNLSDFGINALNAANVKALRITPSGNSDYAFIGYNSASVNLPPNAALSTETSVSRVCPGGTASLEIIGTPAAGGTLSYVWEESTNSGASWTTVTDGGNYSGATTDRLRIANATVGNQYRATVNETGNGNAGISGVFTITAASGTRATSVAISGGGSTCSNTNVQLTSTVTGGSNLIYQWQSNASGAFADIPGANTAIYIPPTTQTGSVDYQLVVSPGPACPGDNSNIVSLAVTGISTTTPAQRCDAGSVTLSATATSGSTVSWYSVESGGSALATGNTYSIPSLSNTTTYYATTAGCSQRTPVVATVYPPSAAGSVTTIPGSSPNTTVLTLASQTGQVLKWQSSTDNFVSAVADIASTESQITVTNPAQSTRYRAVVQSGSCASVNSSASTAVVLPIHANSLRLTNLGGAILLTWETYDQDAAIAYDIERSTDGVSFTRIASVPPNNSLKYEWKDENPGTGTLLYRVKEVRVNGAFNYSNTAFIRLNGSAGLMIYPNPVKDNTIKIQLTNAERGKCTVQLFNATGQIVHNAVFNYPGGVFQQSLILPVKLPMGVYRMVLVDAKGEKTFASLIVE